ncbi:MAG: SAF domain-containing protein [Microvirga sp.]
MPNTIARAALFADAAIAPIGAPLVEVVAVAKKDLRAGEEIDELGGYIVYGVAENAEVAAREDLLPIGIAPGCRLKRDLPKDTPLTYADVEVPAGRICDALRREQMQHFFPDLDTRAGSLPQAASAIA